MASTRNTAAPVWKAFSLTYVSYLEGDPVSLALAVSSLAPLAILVGFATLVLFRRDLHSICFFMGQLGNELLNYLLKHWLQEPRPSLPGFPAAHYGKYGLPSSHAQFMAFFTAYCLLFVFVRLKSGGGGDSGWLWKSALALALLGASATVCVGRVVLGHHTLSQVLWGAGVGVGVGGAWFAVVHSCLTPLFPWIASWPVSEVLLVRDYTLIPSVIFFEYTCARSEARVRARKISLHNLKRHQ